MIIRRIAAYFIDILIITFAASMLASISYLNPQLNNYSKVYEEYKTYVKDASALQENVAELEEINYKLERNNIYGATISIVLTLVYFVIFQKYNNGQTLGKKIMKIKIDGNLSLFKYLIRACILYNTLINVLKVGLILILSKQSYMSANKILYVVALGIEVTNLVMVLMRADKRGLHDLASNSNVVRI